MAKSFSMKTGPLHCFGFECARSIREGLDRLRVDALYADFGKECGLIKAAPQSGLPQPAYSGNINIDRLHEA